MKRNDEIIKIHEQRYQNSCVPSAVEIVLKLEGLIEPDDYYLQEHFGNTCIGGGDIVNFFNEEKKNITFYQKVYGDLESYFNEMKNELSNTRYVIVPLATGPNQYHNHVVYDYSEKEGFKTFTRHFKNNEIISVNDMEERFRRNYNEMINKEKSYGVDILVYTMDIRVNYLTEPYQIKNQGKTGEQCERSFASLEKAKTASLPKGYMAAIIQVKNGAHVYSVKRGWEFLKKE
jgi:hypothetical protein